MLLEVCPKRQQCRRRRSAGRLLVPLSCVVAPLLSVRKRGPTRRASELPPTPKFLRHPESQVALCPISYRKRYRTSTGSLTITYTRDFPSAISSLVGPERFQGPKNVGKCHHARFFDTAYSKNEPGNFSHDETESCSSCAGLCHEALPADI